ncbi:MAG: ABC transporter ATP-binding protein [Verrucomicrobiae bacterium]|nr:ABC transporter ATP-binding protein [Verrucomicrobiae bacterium]
MNLSATDLSFAYGATPLFEHLHLETPEGRILGILGPNGAGKSTLLKLLHGELVPGHGKVALANRPIDGMRPGEIARLLAIIPQSVSISFAFTVREFVAMGRRPHLGLFGHPGPADRECVSQALLETGLEHLADRPVTRLSGGETQLAALARAFAQQPRILLLDEATANLDLAHTARILTLIRRRVRENGLTVLAVLHDINLAAAFCTDVVFLHQGRLLGPQSPDKLLSLETIRQVYGISPDQLTLHIDPFFVSHRFA